MRSSTLFTLLALAGGAFAAWRSGDEFAGAPAAVAVIAVAVVAGFGVAKSTEAIGLAIARRTGGGSLDGASEHARWWWVASTIVGSLAVSDVLRGRLDWSLLVFAPVFWLGTGTVGSWVLLRRERRSLSRADHPS